MSGVMAAGFFVGYGWHWASDDAGAACRTRLKQGLWRLAAVDGAGWLFGGLLYLIFGMFLAGTERSLAVCMEHWRKQIWRIAVSCDDDAVSSPAWAIGFAIYRLCASRWLVLQYLVWRFVAGTYVVLPLALDMHRCRIQYNYSCLDIRREQMHDYHIVEMLSTISSKVSTY